MVQVIVIESPMKMGTPDWIVIVIPVQLVCTVHVT